MSLPALPDGIPVFLFLLLVSELFTLSFALSLSLFLALLTGHSHRANEAMSGPSASFSVNGLLAYLSVVNLPLTLPALHPLPLSSTAPCDFV